MCFTLCQIPTFSGPPHALWVLGQSASDHAYQQGVRQRMQLCWVVPPLRQVLALRCTGCCPADQQDVRQRMNLRWGVMPFRLDFADNPEENIERTFK